MRLVTGARQRRKPGAKGSMTETASGPQAAGRNPADAQSFAPTSAYGGGSAPSPANCPATSGYTGSLPSSAPSVTDWTPTSSYE